MSGLINWDLIFDLPCALAFKCYKSVIKTISQLQTTTSFENQYNYYNTFIIIFASQLITVRSFILRHSTSKNRAPNLTFRVIWTWFWLQITFRFRPGTTLPVYSLFPIKSLCFSSTTTKFHRLIIERVPGQQT